MSGSNIFGNSPATTGSRFASPLVKILVTIAVFVGVLVAYVVLSGQASSILHGDAGPPKQPTPQTSPAVAPFKPMPPPEGFVPPDRPKAQGPSVPNLNTGKGPNGPDPEALGRLSKIEAYTARSSTGTAPAPVKGDRADPDDIAGKMRTDNREPGVLEASVTPTKFDAAGVTELPHPDYLIEQGRYLPCTQMSIINSTVAGSVSAIIPVAIRGSTGDIELMGPGSTVFGTIEHGLDNGAERAFVLWQQITTPVVRDKWGVPHKFRVQVNSPMSDALGQTGADGEVNRHLAKKIGGIVGISLLNSATQGLSQYLSGQNGGNNNRNNSSFNFNFGQMENSTQSASNMLLRQWIDIPDVLTRLQGKECTVAIIRDLDMKAAYPQLKRIQQMSRGG